MPPPPAPDRPSPGTAPCAAHRRRVALGLLALLAAGCRAGAPDYGQWQGPLLTVDVEEDLGPVSPLVFGAAHRAAATGAGSADPVTGRAFDTFAAQVKAAGVTALRFPGGTMAGTYRWARAIGPQAGRRPQVAGSPLSPVPLDSLFGPDEFGDLLGRTGATGVLMLNFGTGTPGEAAALVAYLGLPQGAAPVGGIDWPALRAANGHPEPYPIAWAEVGNEPSGQGQDQRYWMAGQPVDVDPGCAATPLPCLYALGGSTRFTRQPVVGEADWRAPTSVSSGEPGQVVWARFPPVSPGSATVLVDGEAWQQVETLAGAAPDDAVFRLDGATGRIAFGDGVHGAIPTAGALLAVSYLSGPHGGFVDYYDAVKAVRPDLRVCAAFDDPAFLAIMGSTRPYDCQVVHPYVSAGGIPATDADDQLGRLLRLAEVAGERVARTRAEVDAAAGARAGEIELAVTEYGLLPQPLPPAWPGFLRTQGMGVLQALLLRQWVTRGVGLAMRHALTDFTFGGAPADLSAFFVGDQALLQGPGPATVPSPSALAFQLVRAHTGGRLIGSTLDGSPVRTLSDGTALPALAAFATSDADGAFVVLVNQDPSRDVDLVVAPRGARAWTAPSGQVLAAPAGAITSAAEPDTVWIADLPRPETDGRGDFRIRCPAHSVIAYRLPRT